MSLAKEAGLADRSCQLYMFFYYAGPACVASGMLRAGDDSDYDGEESEENISGEENSTTVATRRMRLIKVGLIAVIDVVASTMNYTGSTMAGPTIFAIIYSSVTVWCALLSRILLGRRMIPSQWFGVALVFGGLAATATDSISFGPSVFNGAAMIVFGSAFHALMYVLSESVMKGACMSPLRFCAIFNCVGCAMLFLWQVVYTRPRMQKLILDPMHEANVSIGYGLFILLSIAGMSFVHSLTFFQTVRNFPGGATSAGVMKALQAVLVFVATTLAFCGRLGGREMCFTVAKFISLVVVVVGVLIFGKATDVMKNGGRDIHHEYEKIGNDIVVELDLDGRDLMVS